MAKQTLPLDFFFQKRFTFSEYGSNSQLNDNDSFTRSLIPHALNSVLYWRLCVLYVNAASVLMASLLP